jgi:hypothetical protein
MKLHVVGEFGVEAASVDQIFDSAEELAHDGPPDSDRMPQVLILRPGIER